MLLAYRQYRLKYESSVLEIEDTAQRATRRIPLSVFPSGTRRLFRNRRILPAVLLAVLHDVVHPGEEPARVILAQDKTYAGCRDILYQIALVWNRRLRPTFVPRPRPIDLPEAFGGQGALTPFRNIEAIVFYEKESGRGRLRLRTKGQEDKHVEFALSAAISLSIHWIAIYLYSADPQPCGCSKSSRRISSGPDEGEVDEILSAARGTTRCSPGTNRVDPPSDSSSGRRGRIELSA